MLMTGCKGAWATFVVAAGLSCCLGRMGVADEVTSVGLRHSDQFRVELHADDDLAHDIYCMTIDARGRVVVSGPGYIRILVDSNQDGVADEAREFARPNGGVQGMYFFGNDLICMGDEGLVRYRDHNGDDRADGPPETFVRLKTGGEHDAHAIHRGPDGWWYVIAGNNSGINEKYISTESSPVRSPRAGVVMRFSPDLTQGEVVAEGFRNAYDFTFDTLGEIHTCDSDGERDVSLPWYRPARMFQVLPAGDAGWVSESWKRPDESLDMLPAVTRLGRGSPTGIVCYRHPHFPPEWQSAMFVADWTYGRVVAIRPKREGGRLRGEAVDLLKADGTHGFAPTAMAVGPDGALYISVGGRGTRGCVYRVSCKSRPAVNFLMHPVPDDPEVQLDLCLNAPDPLSSWSRKVWEPLALKLGSDPFIRAAEADGRSPGQRRRAIEILTEKFHGIDGDLAAKLLRAKDSTVRARAAWALGRAEPLHPKTDLLAVALADSDPWVVRAALEPLLGCSVDSHGELQEPLANALASADPTVRQLAIRVLERTEEETFHAIAAKAATHGWQAGCSLAAAYALRHDGIDPYTLDIGLRILGQQQQPLELRREAARILQLGLGDVGRPETGNPSDHDPVFDGYASTLAFGDDDGPWLVRIEQAITSTFPTGDSQLDDELTRLAAMVRSASPELTTKLLSLITETSDPVRDLHQLVAVARCRGIEESHREPITTALLNLQPKIDGLAYVQDTHWEDRLLEAFAGLATTDPDLPAAMLAHPSFGAAEHTRFLQQFPEDLLPQALEAFSQKLLQDPDSFRWNSDAIYLLSNSQDPRVQNLIRDQFDDFGLRGAILTALADEPRRQDRSYFIAGLDSPQHDVLSSCLTSLVLLEPSLAAEENVALLRLARRLQPTEDERLLRDQAVETLARNTRHASQYQLGRDGDPQVSAIAEWTAYIEQTYPEEYARQTGIDQAEVDRLESLLANVDWHAGDTGRGRELFQKRACIQCHGSSRAIGPDLTGVTGRFSKTDLFTAIALPSRDVPARYQATLVVTEEGQTLQGMVVYESVDGIVLRDTNNHTLRIEADQIATRRQMTTSIMPTGLLKDLGPADLADLYAYLASLSRERQGATAQSGTDGTRE
ncbi:MAG: c-type cytochrome [Planctomycetaceae bacterium]